MERSNQIALTSTPSEQENIRTTFFLSPSAADICIICHIDITVKYPKDKDKRNKLRLWKDSVTKTKVCLEVEKFLGEEIQRNRDFQCICQSCYKKVLTNISSRREKEESFQEGRKMAAVQFLRTRTKRSSFDEPPSKKKLFKPSCSDEQHGETVLNTEIKKMMVQGSIYNDESEEIVPILESYKKYIYALVKGDLLMLLEILLHENITDIKKRVFDHVLDLVKLEVKDICSTEFNSSFRAKNVDLSSKVYEEQHNELKEKAPFLRELAFAVALNPRADNRNKMKTTKTLVPSIINAVSSLLLCRNQHMNTCATINTLILRRGKADKMCYNRFQALNICLSHNSVLKKQLELGKNFEDPVKELTKILEESAQSMASAIQSVSQMEEADIEIELSDEKYQSGMQLFSLNADESFLQDGALNPNIEIISLASKESEEELVESNKLSIDSLDGSFLDIDFQQQKTEYMVPNWNTLIGTLRQAKKADINIISNLTFHPTFMIVGDNVDLLTKRRHYLMGKGNIDRHFFNIIVVSNRIKLPDELIGKKKVHYDSIFDVPMNWFIPTIHDESTLKEEIKILLARDLCHYVPELKWMKDLVVKHIEHEFSDLTSQRSDVYPLGIIDFNEASTEGIIEIMRYQHQFVPGHDSNHLVRIFSIGDLLTIERQQNAQDDLSDSASPSARLEGLIPGLADFHSYGNFMEVIWHILYNPASAVDIGTLFQARNFLNARAVPASPMKDINASEDLFLKYSDALVLTAFDKYKKARNIEITDRNDSSKNRALMDKILTEMVEEYIIPEIPEIDAVLSAYQCPFCSKTYKRAKSLRNHIKDNHKQSKLKEETTEDAICNYSKNAFALSFIVKDFIDARKHGDGKRILKLYKFLLLYFKVDSRTKYSYQALHLLAQVSFLLPPALSHELTWNRFVNTKGGIDTNVELDRHLEHHNNYVKADLSQYQGKLTEKSIERCSRSYKKLQTVVENIDAQLLVKEPSGRHTPVDWVDDVNKLAEQFINADIFAYVPGRYHTQFPGFPKSCLSSIDLLAMKRWVYAKLEEFQNMNIYKFNDIVTGL